MTEETNPRCARPIWIAIIVAAITVPLLVGAGVAFYFGLLPNLLLRATPPEHSARYYPDDTLVYMWFTLNPGDGQREHMLGIWNRLEEYSAFRNWKADAQDALWRETGTDLEDNLLPWLGAEISLGVLDMDFDSMEFEIAITIEVRDHAAARDFLTDWLANLEQESAADFDRKSKGDFNLWIDDHNGDAFALSEKLLIFATDEFILDDVLERATGENDRTLLADEDFNSARSALPSRRFTSVYVNSQKAISIIEDTNAGEYLDSEFYDAIPDWIASSAGWVERGIVFEVVAPHPAIGAEQRLDAPEITEVARLMPQDTLALLAMGFDPNVQNWRDALEEYDFSELAEQMGGIDELGLPDSDIPFDLANLNLAHMLDFGILGFDILTGIDLERDFFAHLDGELIVGVREFDYEAVSRNPERSAVDAAALLSYSDDGERALEATLEDLTDWLHSLGEFDIDTVNVGADNNATLVDLGGIAYSPGYVLHDGYLTIATTDGMLEQIVQLQNGDGDSLKSNDEYQRVVGHLGQASDMLIYINLHTLARLAENEELELTNGQQRLLQESSGAIAAISTTDEDHSRFRVALTLFPGTE